MGRGDAPVLAPFSPITTIFLYGDRFAMWGIKLRSIFINDNYAIDKSIHKIGDFAVKNYLRFA
ncbi:hypothetical protein B9G53_12210 [Pseudanabaena sp. SR411]|nr:hypothetical protein B9G53_12210 [Pseudanabaena sp. SR411]